MSHRATKFASAVLAIFLANAPLTAMSYSSAAAADDCLLEPKGQTPQGSHWYYRMERGTKRHCWYLKDENDKVSQAAPTNIAPAVRPVSPKPETTARRSLDDARAELPLPQTRFDPQPGVGQPMAAPAVNAASPDGNQHATAPDAGPQASLIASRWPDPSNVNSPAGPAPATDNSDTNAQVDVAAASPPVAAASPAVATVPLAAADLSSVKQPVPMQTLLLVVIGALALAGLIGSVVFRFGSRRRTSRRQKRGSQRVNWDAVAIDRPSPSPSNYPGPRARMPQADIPREFRAANDLNHRVDPDDNDLNDRGDPDDRVHPDGRTADNGIVPDDRITEMLARLARSSMN
jgi:hypothetical protein